jgi:hypothetical protein
MFKSKFAICLATSALTLGTFLFVASCHKKDTTTPTTSTSEDTGYAADQLNAEKSYSDAESIANVAASTTGSMAYRTTGTTLGPCAIVTHTGDSIIVDFGTTDCLCADGRYRRGKIFITYTGVYADSGSTHTITFDNYYQNDDQVTGYKTVTNAGHNSSGQIYFNVTINGKIMRTTGAVDSVNWTRVRTWLTGSSTATWTDDSYSISGNGTMIRTTSAGVSTDLSVSIPTATPLVVAYDCRWIESGTIDYTLTATGATRSINFGTTPVCNDTAVLTGFSGASVTVIMP